MKVVLVYNIYEMYVCTEKAAIQEWLKEIEELKAENKRFEELLTKGKDKRIEILIKENRELRKQNKEIMDNYIMSEKAADARIEELGKENKELKKKLNKLRTDNIYEEGLYN